MKILTVFCLGYCTMPISCIAQVSVLGTAISPGDFLGSSNGVDVVIKANNVQKAVLLQANGFLGVGSIFNPNFKLDIDAGDINLNTLTNAYRIGDGSTGNSFKVLWHNGIVSNIYVGVGAGNTNATAYNTFVGDSTGTNTGNSIVFPGEGTRNTFVGHLAGFSNDRGQENSFFGDSAGYNTLGGIDNGLSKYLLA
ncbi:MAG: hypothetical protein KBD57_07695 [Bacteroidia bacterium]|nr:hypothetical protein [Bacteroidia bacterium]